MTEEIAFKLVKKFRVKLLGITIDGNEEEHNARRCLKNRKGTFQGVYNNLKTLLKIIDNDPSVEVSLRCNVDMRNPEAIFHLIEILHADGLEKYKNLHVYIAPIHDWGMMQEKNFFHKEILLN